MYNTYVRDTYRRIISVIDELAEILDKKRFPKAQHARIDNIIGYLSIIACTGRAFGVHLILGTQRRSAVHLNQKQRHKKEEIRTHLPQGRISSDFLHLSCVGRKDTGFFVARKERNVCKGSHSQIFLAFQFLRRISLHSKHAPKRMRNHLHYRGILW